jgi:hypothetical protein
MLCPLFFLPTDDSAGRFFPHRLRAIAAEICLSNQPVIAAKLRLFKYSAFGFWDRDYPQQLALGCVTKSQSECATRAATILNER